MLEGDKLDYKSQATVKVKSLEVPPDLQRDAARRQVRPAGRARPDDAVGLQRGEDERADDAGQRGAAEGHRGAHGARRRPALARDQPDARPGLAADQVVLAGAGLPDQERGPADRHHGDRLGREPRQDPAATSSATRSASSSTGCIRPASATSSARAIERTAGRQERDLHQPSRREGDDRRRPGRHDGLGAAAVRPGARGRIPSSPARAARRGQGAGEDHRRVGLRHAERRGRTGAVEARGRRQRHARRTSSSTTRSIARGVASGLRSTASASRSRTAIATRASTSSATSTRTPTRRTSRVCWRASSPRRRSARRSRRSTASRSARSRT